METAKDRSHRESAICRNAMPFPLKFCPRRSRVRRSRSKAGMWTSTIVVLFPHTERLSNVCLKISFSNAMPQVSGGQLRGFPDCGDVTQGRFMLTWGGNCPGPPQLFRRRDAGVQRHRFQIVSVAETLLWVLPNTHCGLKREFARDNSMLRTFSSRRAHR